MYNPYKSDIIVLAYLDKVFWEVLMKKLISISFIVMILFSFGLGIHATLSSDLTPEEPKSIEDLTNDEKRILEELFIIVQEIKEMEEVERTSSIEIDNLKIDIKGIEEDIQEKSIEYDDNLNIMEKILKSYQKSGSNTYLELILGSESLSTLLRRINLLRDISSSTEDLLIKLEDAKEALIMDRNKIQEKLEDVEERQRQVREAIQKQIALKDDLEKRLASLQDEKSKYEEYLSRLENSWIEIKPIFTETINQLTKMIEDGNIPQDTIDINISLTGVKGIIREESLERILSSQSFPTKVEMILNKDSMELILPEIGIEMSGKLEILENNQSLRFNMDNGSYLDMKLEKSALEELFSFGYLEFNFKKLLDKSTIRNVIIYDDRLELIINPILF